MRLNKLLFISTLLLSILNSGASGFRNDYFQQNRKAQGESDDDWVASNYRTALERLLLSRDTYSGKFRNDIKWVVIAHILPPFENSEYAFSLQKTYDNKVEAIVTFPKRESIFSQMTTLRKKNSQASLERLINLVSMDRAEVNQINCPQLVQRASQFEEIQMSPILPDDLYSDGTGYRLWALSLYGNQMEVTLSGPGAKAEKQPYPLLQWIEESRAALNTCLKK
jgi:hypothetical protein